MSATHVADSAIENAPASSKKWWVQSFFTESDKPRNEILMTRCVCCNQPKQVAEVIRVLPGDYEDWKRCGDLYKRQRQRMNIIEPSCLMFGVGGSFLAGILLTPSLGNYVFWIVGVLMASTFALLIFGGKIVPVYGQWIKNCKENYERDAQKILAIYSAVPLEHVGDLTNLKAHVLVPYGWNGV